MKPGAAGAALVLSAGFYGSLAAVRCFGRAGIPVTVADQSRIGPASWSRFTKERLLCPTEQEPDAIIDWLETFGRTHARHMLYATSDEMAFLMSQERERLGRVFDLYVPDVSAIYGLLNKRQLSDHARAVGIDAPRSWFPKDAGDLEQVSAEAHFPVLVKPVTQILFRSHRKGAHVESREALRDAYESIAQERYAERLLAFDASVKNPSVQEYLPEAIESIYNLSGFIDEGGEGFIASATLKVLQRPRRLGVGVCFTTAEVDEDLAAKLRALCRRVGYHGVFEAEFIRAGGKSLLIDFNPRFFGQMGFDIARGVPLPLMAFHGARGDKAALAQVLREAQDRRRDDVHYVHRMALEVMLRAQRLSGALSQPEWEKWQQFSDGSRIPVVDAVLDSDDVRPAAIEMAHQLYGYARHPRAFLRHLVLNKG